MEQVISACGMLCNTCNFFKDGCTGCHSVKGANFWAVQMMPEKVCPLYKCSVIDNKFKDCGQCSELPCKKFLDQKDPNTTEEGHNKSIFERISRLKELG